MTTRRVRKIAREFSLEYCAERLEADPLGCCRLFLISQGQPPRKLKKTQQRTRKPKTLAKAAGVGL